MFNNPWQGNTLIHRWERGGTTLRKGYCCFSSIIFVALWLEKIVVSIDHMIKAKSRRLENEILQV